jgi:hypothetical protein
MSSRKHNETRNGWIKVRATRVEREKVAAAARAKGMEVSEFVRSTADIVLELPDVTRQSTIWWMARGIRLLELLLQPEPGLREMSPASAQQLTEAKTALQTALDRVMKRRK